tara:strand:- start:1514 stop:1735 length:222 start_codon:yes stop_codon:yes gene_type:complete
MVKVICSPPLISVAVLAMVPLTVMYFFLSAFLRADLVGADSKKPTPYSCSRWGFEILWAIWVSVISIDGLIIP